LCRRYCRYREQSTYNIGNELLKNRLDRTVDILYKHLKTLISTVGRPRSSAYGFIPVYFENYVHSRQVILLGCTQPAEPLAISHNTLGATQLEDHNYTIIRWLSVAATSVVEKNNSRYYYY